MVAWTDAFMPLARSPGSPVKKDFVIKNTHKHISNLKLRKTHIYTM